MAPNVGADILKVNIKKKSQRARRVKMRTLKTSKLWHDVLIVNIKKRANCGESTFGAEVLRGTSSRQQTQEQTSPGTGQLTDD